MTSHYMHGLRKIERERHAGVFYRRYIIMRKQMITRLIQKDMRWRHGLDLVLSVNRSGLIV